MILAVACEPSVVRYPTASIRDTAGTDTSGVDTTGGTIKKATLTVQLMVAPRDTGIANALGWLNGTPPPGVQVLAKRTGSTSNFTAASDSTGRAVFANILEGIYVVSVVRQLDVSEVALLGPGDQDVSAFGGSVALNVKAPATNTTLSLAVGRNGSLVISEFFNQRPYFNGQGYNYSQFLELYNNADTTIYLDGKIIGAGFGGWWEAPTAGCSAFAYFLGDSIGVWARWMYAFPGSGTDHPLVPGGLVVVATDAINHTQLFPEGVVDLSRADYESVGDADADNPAVPNLRWLGPGQPSTGHGMFWPENWPVVFLAMPVDTAALARSVDPVGGKTYERVPRAAILDIGQFEFDLSAYSSSYPPCPTQPVNPNLDQNSFFFTGVDGNSEQRQVANVLPNGRKILLRTKNSARDFFSAPGTPFTLP
jgi:hypothetical protein